MTQIINVYNNHLRADQVWNQPEGDSWRRALADTNWGSLLEGRAILLGDFNANSPEWNLHYGQRSDGAGNKVLL